MYCEGNYKGSILQFKRNLIQNNNKRYLEYEALPRPHCYSSSSLEVRRILIKAVRGVIPPVDYC